MGLFSHRVRFSWVFRNFQPLSLVLVQSAVAEAGEARDLSAPGLRPPAFHCPFCWTVNHVLVVI